MTRNASDNVYLHRDFHGALSIALGYLAQRHGASGVNDFIRRFANAYYAPLKSEIRARGLVALKEHFERIYALEGGEIEISLSADELVLVVIACPVVSYLRGNGYHVPAHFIETERSLNAALCEDTAFSYELMEYDRDTGRSVQRFRRRT